MGFGTNLFPEWLTQLAQAVGVNGKRYPDLERELEEARYELDLAQDEIAEMRDELEGVRRAVYGILRPQIDSGEISLGRAAEVLHVSLKEMRERAAS